MAKQKTSLERISKEGAEPKTEIVRTLRSLGQKYGIWHVFEDWIALAALSISNCTDYAQHDKREEQYLQIAGGYNKQEMDTYSELLGCLILEMERQDGHPRDILGPIFHEMELHNKYKGQFFTPPNVCDMTAKMVCGDPKEKILSRGFIGVSEPCCGSGAMALAFASALRDADCNYQTDCWVDARDIDLKCAHMTYLQLALNHIPAIVTHGNTLTMQTYSRWYTPAFILGGWANRIKMYNAIEGTKSLLCDCSPEDESIPAEAQNVAQRETSALTEDKYGQLTFF
jgi:hypothetical protein